MKRSTVDIGLQCEKFELKKANYDKEMELKMEALQCKTHI